MTCAPNIQSLTQLLQPPKVSQQHNKLGVGLMGSGAQGFLVLPTAPVLQQKEGRIVMQQFSEDE